MLQRLLLCAIVLVVHVSHAKDNFKPLRQQMTQLGDLFNSGMRTARDLAKVQVEMASTRLSLAKRPFDAFGDSWKGVNLAATQQRFDDLGTRLDELKRQTQADQQKLAVIAVSTGFAGTQAAEAFGAAVRGTAADAQAATAAWGKRVQEVASDKVEDVKDAAKKAQVGMLVRDLGAGFNSVGQEIQNQKMALDMLQQRYDNAMLGKYLQKKMSDLLNSKAFCEAMKNCESGGKISTEKLQQEIFTGGGGGADAAQDVPDQDSSPAAR